MRLPKPTPGLVLRYAFLWRTEFEAGQDEGRKDRPCTVVVAAPALAGETRVYVLPVTHTPPSDPSLAIEIPVRVTQHLGLDDERSWIVLDEINDFLWPGYDLRPSPGSKPERMEYGILPPRFFDQVREAFVALARARRLKPTPRAQADSPTQTALPPIKPERPLDLAPAPWLGSRPKTPGSSP